ncbi:hypothetical protein BDB01DRAFT_769547 [Pilobolus umbonatus]|nr:hypothetical protein BDB01DRAFT_769547 [Pilobolus umbonatus]
MSAKEETTQPTKSKLDFIQNKKNELEELMKIKSASDDLVKYFNNLSVGMKQLALATQGVSNTIGNWDDIFGVMGEMNTKGKEYPTWVLFDKAEDNKG